MVSTQENKSEILSEKGLISAKPNTTHDSANIPKQISFLQFDSLSSHTVKFQRMADEGEDFSQSAPSSTNHSFRERVQRVFSRKINWKSLWKMAKLWIRDPINIALFVWIIAVAVSGAILFFVMTGMLNSAIPKKSQRDIWFEVNNQILNALFTLMCLYQHPKRIYHLVLLLRYQTGDMLKLRKVYCKNGTSKPREWFHMMVVVALLNLNCFAQYCLCGLNLGYKRSNRPAIGVAITISVAISAAAFAGIYSFVSPLGKDYDSDLDEEAQNSPLTKKTLEKRFSFISRDERRVSWSGGVLDFWDDISLAYLSLFCSCCVFGWHMERLGFGNMYVHIATFLLFCLAPFFIFNLAAVNINNDNVRVAMGVTGLFLCVFGLLYGGFWRMKMRKRFNLPSYNFCCNKPAVADFTLWLFCCWCSLAQEVRTGNAYDIVEDKFFTKLPDYRSEMTISPLPREDGRYQQRSGPSSPSRNTNSLTRFSREDYSPERNIRSVEEELSGKNKSKKMIPPIHHVIEREA